MKDPVRFSITLGSLLLTLVIAMAAAVLYCFDPAQVGFYPRCQFHALTGLQCPGCGGLRAVHALLHGHVASALRLNALLVAALPLGAGLAGWRWSRRRRCPEKHAPGAAAWLWILLAVVIAFGVMRNLPGMACLAAAH